MPSEKYFSLNSRSLHSLSIKSMLKNIIFFIKPHKLIFAVFFVFTILTSVLESLHVAILLPLFNSLLTPSDNTVFEGVPVVATILKVLFPFDDVILSVFILFIAITILKTLTGIFREWLKSYASGTILYSLKKRLLSRYSELSYQNIICQKQGSLIYKCNVSSKMVSTFLLKLSEGFSEGLKIAAIVLVLAGMQFKATSFAIIIGICFYCLSHYFSKRISYNIGKGRVASGTSQNVIINEFLNGIKSIIVFNARERWLKKFDRQSSIFTKLYIKDNIWFSIPKHIMELIAVSLVFGVVVYLKIMYPSQFSSYLPLIGVFAFALVKLLPSMINIGRIRMELLSNLPELENVHKALTEELHTRRKGGQAVSTFNNSIEFSNVSFCYREGVDVLQNIDLTIEKGKVTAFVGASGSGKSSLINLILGLLEPTKGGITVDGVPLGTIDIESWNQRIGLVSQDSFIYHSTVKDNITFGDNSFNEEEIINAAKVANAHDFIFDMKEGYETIVGERGMKLSGGQQQRISIARAILRRPDILIFDEATSALDNISEQMVQEAIQNLSENHTVVLIAHRLSTVKEADKIIVLNEGRIVEAGLHDELIKASGSYYKLSQGGL